MKIAKAPGLYGERGFYKISNPTRKANDFILYSIPNLFRFTDTGNWFVHEDYIEWLHKIHKTGNTKIKYDYEIFHLLPTAPMAIVDSVWRYFAQKYHPDKGGDAEIFKEYNAAYQRIKDHNK